MRTVLAIGALACSAAAGDEIITTFGNPWQVTLGWESVGQSFTVPESNYLKSFSYVAQDPHDGEISISWATLAPWDEEGGHTAGEPVWGEIKALPHPEAGIVTHEVGILLERGASYGFNLHLITDEGTGRAGYVTADAYEGGTLNLTNGFHVDPWHVEPGLDMYFTAVFESCTADVNGDGELNIFDFIAFQGVFTLGSPKADCNGDGVLNVLDFVCFQAAFQAGCGGE